jgi:hypothetical protein
MCTLPINEQYAAMDDTAPIFGLRTAQQEYDAVSAMAASHVERKQAMLEREHKEHMATFYGWCMTERPTESQEAEVNRCLEQQITGDVLRTLVRACLRVQSDVAFTLAMRIRTDAAELYADKEM